MVSKILIIQIQYIETIEIQITKFSEILLFSFFTCEVEYKYKGNYTNTIFHGIVCVATKDNNPNGLSFVLKLGMKIGGTPQPYRNKESSQNDAVFRDRSFCGYNNSNLFRARTNFLLDCSLPSFLF